MNTKNFVVSVNVMLDRKTWRRLGYGDQPSKSEVVYLFATFLTGVAVSGNKSGLTAKYMGAPGHYFLTMKVEVDVPWWRRAGLGDTVSKNEVQMAFNDFVARVSTKYEVTVQAKVAS